MSERKQQYSVSIERDADYEPQRMTIGAHPTAAADVTALVNELLSELQDHGAPASYATDVRTRLAVLLGRDGGEE